MEKKLIGRRILAWVLAGAMLPQSNIAYAAETAASALESKDDILVRWIPEKDQVNAGEEGKITLTAKLNTKRSKVDRAEIEIHLEPEEAQALQLEVFEDAEEVVNWNSDGSANLYFELDSENKKLSQKLIFVVPEDVEELFDIDVDRDDITVTPYGDFDDEDDAVDTDTDEVISDTDVATQTNAVDTVTTDISAETVSLATATPADAAAETQNQLSTATPSTATPSNGSDDTRTNVEVDGGVQIRIETKTLHVVGQVPEYDLSVTAADQADEEDNYFRFQIDAVKVEDSAALTVKDQSLTLKLELPEWISLPQQDVTWNEETSRIQMDGTDLAEITGIPDTMEVTSVRVSDSQTLEVQLEKMETKFETRNTIQEKDENIHLVVTLFHTSPLLEVSETVINAVDDAESAKNVEGQIVMTALLDTTAAGQTLESEDSATATITLDQLLNDHATAAINSTGSLNKNLFWMDNQNEFRIRPTDKEEFLRKFKPEITFKIEGETEAVEFTEENWTKYFGNVAMPELGFSDYPGQISLNNVPTQATWTSPYDETSSKTCSITWSMKQTNLDGNNSKYSIYSVDNTFSEGEEGWYYIERQDFEIDLVMRIAALVPDGTTEQTKFWSEFKDALIKTLGDKYNLNAGTKTELLKNILNDQNVSIDFDGSSFHFKIDSLWKYDLSGAPVVYYMKDNTNTTDTKDIITQNDLKYEDGTNVLPNSEDYIDIYFDNTSVSNHGSETDLGYSGGTMKLQLRGSREYSATKVWADQADNTNRPNGTFQLWRYREGENYSEASQVRDSEGSIKTIVLDRDQNTQNIVFGDLERYDPEGYLYRYVVREILPDGSNDYTQVFGSITVDSATGKETIHDMIAGENQEREYPASRSSDNANNNWLYDGGTLTNKLEKKVDVAGVKVWQASTFQDDLTDVEVQLTLYYKRKDSTDDTWTKVTQPAEVVETLNNFTAETGGRQKINHNMSLYDANGNELIYRWFETKVTERNTANGFENAPNTISGSVANNKTFSLEHDGQTVSYTSENTYNEATGVSTVYNRIADTRKYKIEKQWDGVEPHEITFNLSRTIGGLKGESMGAITFQTDGSLKSNNTLVNPIKASQESLWKVVLEDLPRYDEKGRTYEYSLTESDSSVSLPAYEITVDENGNYSTVIVNKPVGNNHSIFVHKDWIDDGDSGCREPVTIGVYNKDTNVQIGDDVILGDGDIWTKQVWIGNVDPAKVYIAEKQVGECNALLDKNDNPISPEAAQSDGTQSYKTDKHYYKVTYSSEEQTSETGTSKYVYTVQNRRIGSLDLDVVKIWLDGDASKRNAIKEAVNRINEGKTEENQIHWILQLGFSSKPDTTNYPDGITADNYQLTRNGSACDTVTINQDGPFPIYQDSEYTTPGSSWYDLLDSSVSGNSVTYRFYNLPKYDYVGAVINYQVAEIWVDGSGNPINPSNYSYYDGENMKTLDALLAEYHAYFDQSEYQVGALHMRDNQKIKITNGLSGTKNIRWHKQWNDNYNYDNNLRPDIYLNIYRKSDAPGSELETYMTDYQWTYMGDGTQHADSSTSKRHHWIIYINGVDKYDDQGYEWHYYAVEEMKVDKYQLDYTEVQYSRWEDGDETKDIVQLGTEKAVNNENDEQVQYVSDVHKYALLEGGIFTNTIAGNVTISGQKIWQGLPSAYLSNVNNLLPKATFHIDRTATVYVEDTHASSPVTEKDVATLSITDWNKIKDSNGNYKFNLKYAGNYTVNDDGEIHTDNEITEKLLPAYNNRGSRYTYTVREVFIWNGTWLEGQDRGNVKDVYTTKISNYLVTNSYNSIKGALRFKKALSLPGNMVSSQCPAVSMVLTRSYQDSSGTWISDTEFKKEQIWSATDVAAALSEKTINWTDEQKASDKALIESQNQFLFENLDIYAPNGAKYKYKVEEKKDGYLHGFDTWAVANPENGEWKESDKTGNNKITYIDGLYPTRNGADAAGNDGRGTTAENVPVSAVFYNEYQENPENVTLTGTKVWDDYSYQTSKRPSTEEFKGWLKLYRSAKSQPGQNNAIGEQEVTDAKFVVTSDASNYGYMVSELNDRSELDRYAPNGMPWDYVVKEEIPNDSPYQAKDGKTSAESESIDETTNSITLKAITNTAKTKVSYSKTWVDQYDNAIKDDYAGLGTLSVQFKLQVKSDSDSTWSDATNYLNIECLTDINCAPSITGSLTSSVWGTNYWIENLPTFKLDTHNNVEKLSYRVVETNVSINGTPCVSWTIQETSDGLGYKLQNSDGGSNSFIQPYYGTAFDCKLNSDNMHRNKITLKDLTVTKKWANDRNNLWTTRQPTSRPGYDWELKLMIQRQEGQTGDWTNVTRYDSSGTSLGDFVLTLYGKNNQDEISTTVKNLPAYSKTGIGYNYRAVELDGTTVVSGSDGENVYRNTYSVTVDDTNKLKLINTLDTVEIWAEKSWLANDSNGKSVQLQLKYLDTSGNRHAIGSLKGATVTLDGTQDSEPSDQSQFGYEYENWKAKWTVPKVLPQELYTDGATPALNEDGFTKYVVEELNSDGTNNTGYRQTSNSSTGYKNFSIQNEKLMKLSIQKTWYTVANAARKKLTFQIYRIAGVADIPANDTGADPLGTVELNDNTSKNVWSWSGYSCKGSNGSNVYFSKYDSSGDKYLYYAREIKIGDVPIGEDGKATVNGYRYEVAAQTVKMEPSSTDSDTASASFANLQLTNISATKVWKDSNNAYGTRPENLELQLWRETMSKGGNTDWQQVTLTPSIDKGSDGQWTYTWSDLPYYSSTDEKTFKYEVREMIPQISTPTNAQAADSWYVSGSMKTNQTASVEVYNGKATITNTLTGTIQVTGTKTWKDDNRTTRPEDITLTLYRWSDGQTEDDKDVVTTAKVPGMQLQWTKLTDSDTWTYTYSNLPQFNSSGAYYVYKVVETTPKGYRTEYKGTLGCEIQNLGLVTLNVEKKWEAESSAQKEIAVGIYRTTDSAIPADSSGDNTGNSVLIGQVTLNAGNSWKWSGDYLDGTYFDQRTYGEAEEKPYLYYARELKIGSKDVPTGTAGRIVETDDGYRYSVKEEMTPPSLTDGEAVPDTMTTVITNTQLTALTVVKNWTDNQNEYNTRPSNLDDLKLTLYRKAEGDAGSTELTEADLAGISVEKTKGSGVNANQWTYVWKNLPVTNSEGKSYTYYVVEKVPGINTDSTSHGSAYSGRQYVCVQGSTQTEIKKDTDATKTNINRRAELTNVLTAGISISGTKIWSDGDVERPDTLELKLWQKLDGETAETEVAYTLGSDGTTTGPKLLLSKSGDVWTYTFIKLDGYNADGVRYHYRVEETVPDGYRNVVLTDSDDSGLEDLVNLRQVQFQVEKKWRVRDDSVKHEVRMKLYRTTAGQIPETSAADADSEYLGEVILNETNDWKWSGNQMTSESGDPIYFDKYRVFDNDGQLLTAQEQYLYYAREVVEGTGFRITETASLATASNAEAVVTNQQLTSLTVVKEWLDHSNAYKTRPDELYLILYRQIEGGVREQITDQSPEVKKSAGNQWIYTWKDMPIQDVDGNPYQYFVEEQTPSVAADAKVQGASYVCLENQPLQLADDQGKLTNYLKKETDLVGRKIWNDGQYAERPSELQLRLYRQADGESSWEELTGAEPVWYQNSDDTWSFVYENLSRTNSDGAIYHYKVEERVPDHYRVYYSNDDDGNRVLLENIGDGSLTLTKKVTGSGGELNREFHFTITMGTLPDGSKLPDGIYGDVSFTDGQAEVTLKNGQSVRIDHLPGMMSYTVVEEEANLYRYRTTSVAEQGVIEPFAVAEVLFTNARTAEDKDRPVKPNTNTSTTTNPSGPGIITEETITTEDRDGKTPGDTPYREIVKTGDETPIMRSILIFAAAVAALIVLLIFRKKKKK